MSAQSKGRRADWAQAGTSGVVRRHNHPHNARKAYFTAVFEQWKLMIAAPPTLSNFGRLCSALG